MATLKVNITESITLNGNNFGAKNVVSLTGVNAVNKRVVECITGSGGTQVYAGGAATGPGTFISANVKYIRITNTEAVGGNFVILHLAGDSHESMHKLDAGESFILSTPVGFDTEQSDIDNYSGVTIDTIKAKADTAAVKLEVYVATA
jgi:hypothetical protein|tara:strand:+ start:1123 stop:1566 length:444 start_codon:yes stop_codon:yes gene_type:complete